MTSTQSTLIDQNQIKFSMGATALLLVIGFVVNSWLPILIAVICQFAGAAGVPFGPYRLIYTKLVVPNGLVKPNAIPDHHEPHRFASLVGGLFDLIGIILLLAGIDVLGWVFIAIVFVLSNLNLWIGFCAGCFMYYTFNRLGVPGFVQTQVSSENKNGSHA